MAYRSSVRGSLCSSTVGASRKDFPCMQQESLQTRGWSVLRIWDSLDGRRRLEARQEPGGLLKDLVGGSTSDFIAHASAVNEVLGRCP